MHVFSADSVFIGATGPIWTDNLLITSQLRYHCATVADLPTFTKRQLGILFPDSW